jgi:hypothetical protein
MEHRDSERPLDVTREEWQRRSNANIRVARALTGEGLLSLGRIAQAETALAHAVGEGWNARASRLLGLARLARGDTLSALSSFAFAAPDPIEGAAADKTIGKLRLTNAQQQRLAAETVDARRAMHRYILEQTTRKAVRGTPRVWGEDGRSTTVASLSARRVTLYAMVFRECGPSLRDLPALGRLAKTMTGKPINFFAVTREGDNEALRLFWRENEQGVALFHDNENEFAMSLDAHSTPTYIILDSQGRVRWRGHRIAEASPILEALVATGQ